MTYKVYSVYGDITTCVGIYTKREFAEKQVIIIADECDEVFIHEQDKDNE